MILQRLSTSGIGGALLQGLGGFVNNAARIVPGLIQQGVNLAASAAQIAAPAIGSLPGLVSTATQLLQPNAPPTQAAPIYVNPYDQPQNFSLFSRVPSRPWQLGDSDEQFLRGDPYGYINQNAGSLAEFIRDSGGSVLPRTYRAQGAPRPSIPYWGVAPYAFQGQPQSRGFYPSVTSGADFNLNSLIKSAVALAPLISMFFA